MKSHALIVLLTLAAISGCATTPSLSPVELESLARGRGEMGVILFADFTVKKSPGQSMLDVLNPQQANARVGYTLADGQFVPSCSFLLQKPGNYTAVAKSRLSGKCAFNYTVVAGSVTVIEAYVNDNTLSTDVKVTSNVVPADPWPATACSRLVDIAASLNR